MNPENDELGEGSLTFMAQARGRNLVPERPVRIAAAQIYEQAVFIAFVAFIFRMIALVLTWHHGFPEEAGSFGFEVGSVAASIAKGKGFSSPSPLVETGPTAWLCPVYPYLVAGVFKMWGVFTVKSHIVVQVINCIFSALVIFPIRGIAERAFGRSVAIASCWLWVFLPTAWHIPIQYVWETALSALSFGVLFWATLAIRDEGRKWIWAGYGALWALGLLINASFFSVLPFFFAWLAWEAQKGGIPWLRPIGLAVLTLVLGLTPWTVRNYVEFHRPILLRQNLGAMLWWGFNPPDTLSDPFLKSPFGDYHEAAEFQQLGETGYMQAKQKLALEFIRTQPGYAVRLVLRRVWLNWFSVSDRVTSDWSAKPLYLKIYILLNGAMVLLCWYGLAVLLRSRDTTAIPFLIVLVFYPLVYYLTVTLARYRFPMEPIIAILAVYGASQIIRKTTSFQPTNAIGATAG